MRFEKEVVETRGPTCQESSAWEWVSQEEEEERKRKACILGCSPESFLEEGAWIFVQDGQGTEKSEDPDFTHLPLQETNPA